MPAAHVLHCVYEERHRSAILRGAGYDVRECFSERQMAHDLAEWGAELVCISESMEKAAEGALAMARALSDAPVVLFRVAAHNYLQRGWDLEVQPLQHPSVWLPEIERLLERRRADIAQAKRPREPASRLPVAMAQARLRSARLREKLRQRREEM